MKKREYASRDNKNKKESNFKNKREADFKTKKVIKENNPSINTSAKNDSKINSRKYDAANLKVEAREDVIEGRNAVIEALKSERTIEYIMVAKGNLEGSISKVLAIAKEKKIVIKEVDRRKLDTFSETGAHQGVVAIVTPFNYSTVEEILEFAKNKNEKPFIVVLDELEDPHNLGSIVRTAELCGVHGIIIPKRRNVGVTQTVYKSSVGAIEHMKIAKVTNINSALDQLKKEGIWVYGADAHGDNYSYETDFAGACAMVIGSEGRGISKLTLSKCDILVKIPMIGKINSLNASVAGGIMMYEILKSRITRK